MTTLETMTYDVTGRIARITLNRPERGNAITLALPRELQTCVEKANLDPGVHVEQPNLIRRIGRQRPSVLNQRKPVRPPSLR